MTMMTNCKNPMTMIHDCKVFAEVEISRNKNLVSNRISGEKMENIFNNLGFKIVKHNILEVVKNINL